MTAALVRNQSYTTASASSSSMEIGWKLVNAALKGNVNAVEEYLTSHTVGEETRSMALTFAARAGHREVLEKLLGNGPVSEAGRHEAITQATLNGYPDIADLLGSTR